MKGLRSRVQSKKVFLLSGFPQNERKELAKKIQHLGGVYLDSKTFRTNCTHVICGKWIRSEKCLTACATGKWIVTKEFVEASHIKNTWVNEEKYEWQPAPKRWRTLVEKNKEFAFKGWKVAVLAASHNRDCIFKRLLAWGGAELYTMSVPVKNPGNVASKVTYVFTEGKAARTLCEQGLAEYGVLLLKPEFIAAHLLQTSADPMDYVIVAEKMSEPSDDFQFNISQDLFMNSSQDSTQSLLSATKETLPSKSRNKITQDDILKPSPLSLTTTTNQITMADDSLKNTSLKVRQSATIPLMYESPRTPISCRMSSNGSTPYRLSQSSMEYFFKTSRHIAISPTPCSVSKKYSQERCSNVSRGLRMSESCDSLNTSQLFLPQTSLKFQEEFLLSVKTVGTQNSHGKVVSNAGTPEDLKTVLCNLDETPTHIAAGCSAKRKLIEETKQDKPQMKKIKLTNKDNLPTEFSDSLASLIDIYVDEKNHLTALDLTSSMLTVTKYPQPRTIHAIVTNILENASSNHIAGKAFAVLMSIVNLHPPTSSLMQNVYLSTFRSLPDDTSAGVAWNYISHVIGNALVEVESKKDCKNYRLLLQFITSLLKWNFSNLILQSESGGPARLSRSSLVSCMLVQVMWSPSFIITPNSRTRTLLELLQECLMLSVPFVHKQHVVELLLSLVSMVAQCCHWAHRGTSSDIMEGDLRMAFVFELARKLVCCVDDAQVLQVILRHLQPSWLCLRVCQILLGSFDDYLLLNKLDSQQISLAKIVTQYFFLLPRMVLQKGKPEFQTENPAVSSSRCTRNSTQTSDRREMKSIKVLNCTKQSKINTKHLASKINKRNAKGETVLHLACIRNDTLALQELLQVPGIDVNVQDYAGWTPLHEACNHGHLECVEMLLKFVPAKTVVSYFNSDKNCRKTDLLLSTPEGITAFHDAVICNKLDVCKLLLKYGGVQLLKTKTSYGLTPVDLARTAEMKTLLTTSLQQMSDNSHQSLQELVSSQEMASSLDSQQSTESLRTSYIPPDLLYEQVLNSDAGPMRACIKDCLRYLTLVIFLLDSYITTTGLQLKHATRTPKKNLSSSSIKEDSSQESSQKSENMSTAGVESRLNLENQTLMEVENYPLYQNLIQKGNKNILDLRNQKLKQVENESKGQAVTKIKSEPLNLQREALGGKENTIAQTVNRQSHRLKVKRGARETKALRQIETNILPQTATAPRTETAGQANQVLSKSETHRDFYHLRKMKHHLKLFESHLQRITNTEDFKTLHSKLACLKCFSVLSLQ